MDRRSALRIVVLLGVVSLLADVTYEGARSIAGPYLALLGASAAAVGFAAGAGELVGYGLRFVTGRIADRTRRYWTLVIAGYAVNIVVVPALALAGRWEVAVGLLLLERMGKAIRAPARDAILAHVTKDVGHGVGFGLHEALDQTGAVLGPLLVSGILAWRHDYGPAFAVLMLPAIASVLVLLATRRLAPHPESAVPTTPRLGRHGLPRGFWVYVAAAALFAAGTADFALVAYHFKRTALVADEVIPLYYMVAMGLDAVAALMLGRLFDRLGLRVLAATSLLAAAVAPLVFLGDATLAFVGMALWGIAMGAQESVFRAAVAGFAPPDRRGSAFGTYHATFGIAWFIGSVAMGLLYDGDVRYAVALGILGPLLAVPVFLASAGGRPARA